MIRWQYAMVDIGGFSASTRAGMTLSYLGRRGWELTTVFDKSSNWIAGMEKGFILFKRAVPDGEEPDGPWAQVWTSDQIRKAYEAESG